jgi:hypothetical protein
LRIASLATFVGALLGCGSLPREGPGTGGSGGGAPGTAGGAGAAAGAGGAANPPGGAYVPDVPFAYDGTYLDGSFEEGLGFGWDLCSTRTAEVASRVSSGGTEGQAYLRFSPPECAGGCNPTGPSDSELYVWFKVAPSAAAPMGLYFDVRDEEPDAGAGPAGSLRFYGTNSVCEEESLLTEIPIGDLGLAAGWSTRCVTLDDLGAHTAIGVAAPGAQSLGLDALRLGPACHRSP